MIRQSTRYYIAYYQGKRLMEEIRKTQPITRTLCRHLINEMRKTTHKTGQLIPKIWK